MNCSVIYDLTRAGYEAWWFPCLGLVACAGAAAIYVLFRLAPAKLVNPSARGGILLVMPLSLIWSLVSFILTYSEYDRLRNAYEHGAYQEVSGRIKNYTNSGPDIQPGTVRFAVDNATFSYSRYEAGAGYHGAGGSGTPLRDGVTVRVKHIENSIVRLEVCGSSTAER